MKPALSWFDDVLLDAVIVNFETPHRQKDLSKVFNAKSDWIPEFLMIPTQPYYKVIRDAAKQTC